MQEAYVNILDVPTHIMTWGKWIEESFNEHEKEVVICITGNPGLPGFYTKFLATVHSGLECQLPVWVIGHLGHDEPPENSIRKVPRLQGNEKLFDLEAQVRHKAEFIRKYCPKDVKIHLIGHSIGSYMILELLKIPEIKERIQKCYLLFPTLERMAAAPNGKLMVNFVLPIAGLIGILLRLLDKFPVILKVFLISIYFLIFSIPRFFIGTTIKYLKPQVIEKVLFLADDEMKKVKGLDEKIVGDNLNILKLFYGTTDGWVPVKYYVEIQRKFPAIDATLDDKEYPHAFVLHTPDEVGRIISGWIAENRL